VAIPALESATVGPIEFSWVGETARHIGIVTHRWLQRIAQDGLGRWDAKSVAALAPAVAADLARRGIPPSEAAEARERVLQALRSTLDDARGRWVLGEHREARSEYRIVVASPTGTRLIVIDRTFVDDEGRRWIVDYKTGRHEGGDPEAFLDREMERYAPQLALYAAAFAGERVAVGLYFPLMAGWRAL
jgi:ATP-dependent exoDNAse (exonuclease V) beta subunit